MTPKEEKRSKLAEIRKWTFLLPPRALFRLWTQPGLGLALRVFGSLFIISVLFVYAAIICTLLVRFDVLKLEWRGGSIPALTLSPTLPNYDALESHRKQQAPPKISSAGTEKSAATQLKVPNWTGFRGARRDGVYDGAIRTNWTAKPPAILWRQPCGGGYASFAIQDGVAYTIEQRRKEEVVAAYDVESGRELWAQTHYGLFEESMGGDGPRATPAIAQGRIYSLGGLGTLQCLNTDQGQRIWSTNIFIDAHASLPMYGCSSSPLIVGDSVIVTPGGPRMESVVAYDRHSSRRLWSALEDEAAYSSPFIATLAGVEQLLVVTAKHAAGLNPTNGAVLWEHPWSVLMESRNIAQPVVVDSDRLFLSAGYGTGCEMLRISRNASGVFQAASLWKNKSMKNKFSSSVLFQDHLYGLDEDRLACVDARTGERRWKGDRYGYGQLILANGHLIVLTGDGEVVLVAARPDEPVELGRVRVLQGKTWNHPAIYDGRLLVRNAVEMACIDLRP